MRQTSNIGTVRTLYQAFANADAATLLAGCHPDIVWQVNGNPQHASFFGRRTGHAGVIDFLQQLSAALTDIVCTPQTFHEFGNMVLVTGNDSATGRESGKAVTVEWAHLFTLEQGLVREFREYYDTASITAALEQPS